MTSTVTIPPAPRFPDAPCAGSDPDAWFPEVAPSAEANIAIRVCHTCPHKTPCLDYALTVRVDGIWGGTSAVQRDRMRKQRGIRGIPLDATTHWTTIRTYTNTHTHTAA